jgi:hypothetical protein
MDRRRHPVRHYTVRGHAMRVFRCGQHEYGVTVDGVELRSRFSSSFAAWTAGAEEVNRRDPGCTPAADPSATAGHAREKS